MAEGCQVADAEILVVGGGIVGLCCALALRRRGVEVTLLDPGRREGAASFGNAGHIATEQGAPLASAAMLRSAPGRLTLAGGPIALPPGAVRHWLPFALRLARAAAPARHAAGAAALGGLLDGAMPAWRRLVRDLARPDLLSEDGHWVVWHDPAAAARGLAAWRTAAIGTARLREASPGERAHLGSVMARPPVAALKFDGTGQVADPGAVLDALERAFAAAGGRRQAGRLRALEVADGRAVAVTEAGERLAPGRLLVAAGVASGALLGPAGLRAPIIAERGYHIQAAEHGWPADLQPIVFEDRSTIATRFSGGLRVAGFVEFGRHDAAPDPRRWRALERHAGALGLPLRGALTRWVGSRPTLPDYLPAIGRAPGAGNLFYAFGHQHLGLTLAPLTAELVAGLMGQDGGDPALAAFSLRRFARP
ncbi:FAD-binding oxidoreductase [Lichenibacterium ramalinae]|uniref:FAD-binding oxidoreductase n=1 Tax=Lichenibacterium ramalinae TaxID=2316527 RepID=A0A4Q2RHL2_9HYPH|nr:FAD-binding oxidoreductase [Lichenibacterium ramalinae]